MRKRLLSIILSLNLIFNYSLSGTAVIAEGDEGNTDSGIVDELPKEEEDENDIPPESEIEKEATPTTINLDVIPNEAFPYSIYYGQEIPDFNEKDDNSIPKYYSIVGNDGVSVPDEILEEIYQEIKVEITENFEDIPEKSYELKVINANDVQDDERNIIYHVVTETLDKAFNIQKYENFPEVPLTLYVDGGKQYVRSSDEHFAISLGNLKKSFADNFETGILFSELKKNNNQYYVRNIDESDENSEYRYAISDVLTYNEEPLFKISKAEIINKDFDVSKTAYNKSLQFNVIGEISGYSEKEAENVLTQYLSVKTRTDEKVNSQSVTLHPLDNKNGNIFQFIVPCEVKLGDGMCFPLSVVGGFDIEGVARKTLSFEYDGENIGNSLMLENVKPYVKELEVDGKTITVTVKDAHTGIASIEYGIEGMYLNSETEKWEKSANNETVYYPYVDASLENHPKTVKFPIELKNIEKENGYNLCLKIKDYAGNSIEPSPYICDFQIDNDAPKIIVNNGEWYKDGEIKIKISDENGVASFKIKDADGDKSNIPVEIESESEFEKNLIIPISRLNDGKYHLTIEAEDKLENSVDTPTEIDFNVDKTKPEIQVFDIIDGNESRFTNEKWYGIEQKDDVIKITVDEENLSSFTVKEGNRVLAESKNEKEINIPISMFQDGEHCLTINAEDVAGNPAEEKVIVFHVDTARPTIKVFDVVDGKEFSFTNDNENWYGIQQQGDSIRIEISEQFSELTVMDETTNKSFKIENNKEYVIPISEFSENGEHRLKIDVVDMAGNPNSEEIIFNVDTEAPVVTALKDKEWDKRSFQISDKGSEIVNVKYSYDGEKWITKDLSEIENGILTLDALDKDKIRHNVVFVRATDKAGNTNNENGKVFEFPKDEQRPELESIEIYYDASKNDTPDWQPINEDVFHAYQYGNFTNKKIEIRVRAEDKPNENSIASGLNLELLSAGSVKYHEHYKKVESLDEDGNVLLDENGNVKYEEVFDSYAFTFEKVGEYKNVSIHLEDIAGNTNNIPLNFNSSEPQGEADYIIPEDLKTNYTTPIYQNSLIIDNTAPIGAYDKPNFVWSESSQTNWYGIAQKEDFIKIIAHDDSTGTVTIFFFRSVVT